MTADSNVPHHAPAPTTIPLSRQLYWSMRRELWENHSLYIAPLVVAGLIVAGTIVGPITMHNLHVQVATDQRMPIEQGLEFAALLIMGTAFLVAVFYCLDALYGERRDRSILFWKSLPVSDLTTVFSKIAIPMLLLPLVVFAITLATQALMVLIGIALLPHPAIAGTPGLLPMWGMLFYHLIVMHGLWYAPFYGWLLLVSAWAKRAPLLWAVLPPFAVVIFEKIAFDTSFFAAALHDRFSGGAMGAVSMGMSSDSFSLLSVGKFLISPGMWIGLAITAGFLAGAVLLRRYRSPI